MPPTLEDAAERAQNLVKFVRLNVKLKEILGERRTKDSLRQAAAEKFRDLIHRCKVQRFTDEFRIIVKEQKELWEDGLRAGRLFAMQRQRDLAEGVVNKGAPGDEENDGNREADVLLTNMATGTSTRIHWLWRRYGGGNMGSTAERPIFTFGSWKSSKRFLSLSARSRESGFGVKSGCDAFFMPRDVSQQPLFRRYQVQEWNNAR